MCLILKEPDLGSALVLLPTGLAMLFVAGIPRRYLVRLLGGVGILGALFVADVLFAPSSWQIKLEDYQRRRLLVYFGKKILRLPVRPRRIGNACASSSLMIRTMCGRR